MKLVRNATSESDQYQRDSAIFRATNLCRGRVNHFTIEKASAIELEAMDNLLIAAGFGEYCDTCPVYDEGWSCGWWVALDEVDAFRAAYKKAKSEVAAEVGRILELSQVEALEDMTQEQVKVVSRVAMRVRHDLRKGESIGALRAIPEYKNISMNPYHTTRSPLTAAIWEMVAQCLVAGTINDVCSNLLRLERNADVASEQRSPELKANDLKMAKAVLDAAWQTYDHYKTIGRAQSEIVAKLTHAPAIIKTLLSAAANYDGEDAEYYGSILLTRIQHIDTLISHENENAVETVPPEYPPSQCSPIEPSYRRYLY